MYVASDPRSQLTATTATATSAATFGDVGIGRHYAEPPQVEDEHQRTWITRGESFLTAYSEAQAGADFVRHEQADEYLLLIEDREVRAEVLWNGTVTPITGHSVTFVPAGQSSIRMLTPGVIVRFLTTAARDLAALAINAADYNRDVNVPPVAAWPDPVGGYKARSYSLDVEPEAGRMGRIFRSSTFMINCQYPRTGPRDPAQMSPHDHADFQQCSLILAGSYVHHLRWPWTTDKRLWRDDRHEICASPSVTFIPARVIHTSEATGLQANILYDIFCPPRADFSGRPGWVLNADDYPEPAAS